MVRTRRLIFSFVAVLLLASCASAPAPEAAPARDARDPDIWRPTAPARYPEPR